MKNHIAYCGLDCESCEARIATVHNDDALRHKVAALWSNINGVEITPEMINCVGCRIDGVKTPYCESLCPIRPCAMSRGLETCGSCAEMERCEKLGAIIGNNADAARRLKTQRDSDSTETVVELRAISEENFLDAFRLSLAPGQERFVSHPIRSLAQAYIYRDQCQPFGICAEGRMVGYVMVIYDYDVPAYNIWHMMIDESAQGQGYGSAALDRVLAYIRTKPFGPSDRVVLTCNKDNLRARRLYESRGFRATGVEDEDEIELALTRV